MTRLITTIETEARLDGAPRPIRLASEAGFVTGPEQAPRRAAFEARIRSAGNYERHAFASRTTQGSGQVGTGVVELDNNDRAYDWLAEASIDDQPIVIRRGPSLATFPGAPWITYFSGLVAGMEFGWRTVKLHTRTRQAAVFDRALMEDTYRGDNVVPSGWEGTPADLGGKPLALLLGGASHYEPPRVNAPRLIFHVSAPPLPHADGTVPGIGFTVFHKGVLVPAGVHRGSDPAALDANIPAPTTYDWVTGGPRGTFFRLGFDPDGPITVTAQESVTAMTTVGQLCRRAFLSKGVLPGDIVGAEAIDAVAPDPAGLFLGPEPRPVADVVAELLEGVGGFCVDSRNGPIRLGVLTAPSAPVALTIEEWHIKGGADAVEIVASEEPGINRPIWEQLLDYDRVYQVQNEVAPAAAALAAYLAQEFRTYPRRDEGIRTAWPRAGSLRIRSCLRTLAGAARSADRLWLLRSVRRRLLVVPLDPAFAAAVDLMETVRLNLNRFGWNGRLFRVLGQVEVIAAKDAPDVTQLVLWG